LWQRWLDEFPSLANSSLGKNIADTFKKFPGWGRLEAVRLANFYESELFVTVLQPQLEERLRQLEANWGSK
jgi:hypothetical protein